MFDKDGKEVNIPFDTTIEKTDNATINIEDEKIQVYNEEITYNLDINGNIIENK